MQRKLCAEVFGPCGSPWVLTWKKSLARGAEQEFYGFLNGFSKFWTILDRYSFRFFLTFAVSISYNSKKNGICKNGTCHFDFDTEWQAQMNQKFKLESYLSQSTYLTTKKKYSEKWEF